MQNAGSNILGELRLRTFGQTQKVNFLGSSQIDDSI